MDFFKDIKAKLAEFEEQARLAAEAASESQRVKFQPKGQRGVGNFEHPNDPAFAEQQHQGRRYHPPVNSEHLAVEESSQMSGSSGSSAKDYSIFDNLGEHLEDAYLLQEILGPPLCMREWD